MLYFHDKLKYACKFNMLIDNEYLGSYLLLFYVITKFLEIFIVVWYERSLHPFPSSSWKTSLLYYEYFFILLWDIYFNADLLQFFVILFSTWSILCIVALNGWSLTLIVFKANATMATSRTHFREGIDFWNRCDCILLPKPCFFLFFLCFF